MKNKGFFSKKEKKLLARKDAIVVTETNALEHLDGYYRLRDNFLFVADGGKNKIFQIESSISGEAKTTTCCNLGVLLGQSNKKVLIIDLDFKRSEVHKLFKCDGANGLAEYMTEAVKLDTAIKHTEYQNVDILPRGGTIYNSALVLISDRFKNLLLELKEKYDVILLDTSPVLQTSDYIHISKLADATLFLVAYGIIKKNQVREAIRELKKSGANLVGTVFTFYTGNELKGKNYYSNYYSAIE